MKVIYQLSIEGQAKIDKSPIDDYKNPMAARQLLGVLKYINDFTVRPINTLHPLVNQEKQVVHLFFNCHTKSIMDALTKPVPTGYFEASFYQNLLDNLGIPDEIDVDLDELREHPIVKNG